VKAGSESTTLIVIRGNSASGKSAIAAEIRARCRAGIAIVGQDHLRRAVLKEKDKPGAANIGLIDLVTRYALDHEYTTVLEGILYVAHYGEMLIRLRDDHLGRSLFYYIDIPFEETLRRHAGKPQAAEYGRPEMSQWYRDKDLLPGGIEDIIPADSSLEDTVQQIMVKAELAGTPASSA
jgi:predicted kinase